AAAQGTTVLSETGHKDCSAEEVAERLLAQTKAWLSKRVPIDGHLASQLLLPMALAGGGSFVTAAPTAQFHGQAKLLGVWLGARVELVAIPAKSGDVVRVVVHRA
ncbi:MAG: hypothetical protein KC502_13455, partial [Myxococcales bacterium]|nr:hypothetical protein [Myxococcales bacterium]